ncbi:hypothetical protein JCM9492_12840 [Aquifex pyrophilus]
MGKIVEFPFGDEPKKEERKGPQPLTEKDFEELLKPFSEGLKKLYPSQVKEVKGVIGLGEKNGNEKFVAGLLIWESYKHPYPIVSSFIAVFKNNNLEKVSFLEAKNNYWDWKLLLKTYKDRFNTEEIFKGLQELKKNFTV